MPPLTTKSSGGGGEEASMSLSAGDPLVDNGLGSPLCHAGGEGDLSQASQSDCQTSGFEAAPAPTGNYGFDVHINTGITEWTNDADAIFQDLLELGWMVLEAVVHGVIVMLEWCYTLDLLNSPVMSGVASGLRQAQAIFTQPWLVLALSVASVLAMYHGLVRRQVTETLGQALMMGAMMVGGLWVIMNPAGTIGALGGWANQAGLGTLGAVTSGTPDHPDRTLAESMRDVFSGAIEGPWCYMEFGEVGWCENPALRDPRLRATGLKIAASETEDVGCESGAQYLSPSTDRKLGLPVCVTAGSEQAKGFEHSAELLRKAQSNGAIFLALPANGPERNSIKNSGSLFNVLCGGSTEPCKGPTAAQAEFRTGSGTGWRFMGLFFIWFGGLGMILMLGFIALRLLAAALGSMLYLLLAPAAVLAPALGDGGRAAFRGWATRLLSAVMSKLIYSFLLGVLLLMERILTVDLTVLGWFTQWLLISTMWWGAFLHRHQMLNFAQGGRSESRIRGMRLTSALMSAREMGRVGGMVRRKLSPAAPSAEKRQRIADAARGRAKTIEDGQVEGSLEQNYREAQAQMAQAPEIQQRISGKQRQLAHLKRNHDAAREKEQEIKRARKSALADPTLSSGVKRKIAAARFDARFGDEERSHRRRAAEWKARMDRVQGEITTEQGSLTAARQTVNDGDKEKRKTGKPYTREQAAEQARLFETQAALPDRGRAGPGGEKRNYAAAASIAKYGRRQYEELDAGGKRVAQLETDRELARLKAARTTAKDMATRPQSSLPPREQSKLNKGFDRKVEQQMGTGGHGPSPSRTKGSPSGSSQHNSRTGRRSAGGRESGPVRDFREAAARRKRQLGRDR
jgi:hypothetical protein